MTQDDPSAEISESLVRRLINEMQEPQGPDEKPLEHKPDPVPPGALVSPISGQPVPAQPPPASTAQVSPIRPHVPDHSQPQLPLTPSLPEKTPPVEPLAEPLTPREHMQRAEEALIKLREKMSLLAAEFAQGKLNQAQFDAVYSRYSEQRMITERLLARDPTTQAWQSVVQPGHTKFLKARFEARVISYAIYDRDNATQIAVTGTVQLQQAQVEAVLTRLKAVSDLRGNPGPAHKKLPNDHSVLFVPGDLTVAVAIFSLEPSAMQYQRVQDIHRDFERANQQALRRKDYLTGRLVFPHRALFEEKKF